MYAKLILHFFCLFFSIALYAQTLSDITEIDYNSLARGYHEQIIFTPDSVKVVKKSHREAEKDTTYSRKLLKGEWEELIHTLNDVKLKEISELQSPTRHRAFDGARHSTIQISTSGGHSFAHSFDDENPHKKLQLLMNSIKKIAGLPPEK